MNDKHAAPSTPAIAPRTADATSLGGTRNLYRLHAPFYDATRWTFLRGRAAAVEWMELRPGDSALEVGCGTGSNLLRLRSLVGETGSVHGVDASPHMLAQARAKLARRTWRNAHLHEYDAGQFELGRRFEAILYSYSLSMIPRWQESLGCAARHLSPGGRLVVVDFGDLGGCRLLRGPLRRWLRAHHVESERPYVEALVGLFGPDAVTVRRGRAGWHFLARGTAAGA